ncbi:MAG: hypothetical protein ACRD12_16250 [Acidimicrobiales bacterium]
MGRQRVYVITAVSLGVLAALAAASPGISAPEPIATAAVQVTANPAPVRNHSSPQLARNPDTGELVIVESDVRGDRACKIHISTDDGRSWRPGGDMMVKPFTDCAIYAEYGAYASLAFSKDGTLFVAFVASDFLGRERNETPRHIYLARSSDSGRTFDVTRVFEAPDGNPDRGLNKGPMLAIDPADSQRIYIGWRQGIFAANAKEKLKSNVAASADGGRTFGPPVDLTDDRGGDYPALAVGRDGTVHAVYWNRVWPPLPMGAPNPIRPIYYRQSTDHGKTWSPLKDIDPGNQRADRPPLLAADPNSNSLYMVWYASNQPENQKQGYDGDIDIYFLASADGGNTWGDRKLINDDATPRKTNQYDPGLAIAPNGRVDVAWLDGRNSPIAPVTGTSPTERGHQDVYYASSTDGGRTFTPNLLISDRAIDRSLGTWENNVGSHHNLGVASTNAVVYVAWQDSRNARQDTQPEDVYMTSIRLTVTAAKTDPADAGAPTWVIVGCGVAIGMALAMGAVVLRNRSARRS